MSEPSAGRGDLARVVRVASYPLASIVGLWFGWMSARAAWSTLFLLFGSVVVSGLVSGFVNVVAILLGEGRHEDPSTFSGPGTPAI
jgi:hypothetical protein